MIMFQLLNSPTIIPTIPSFKWPLMRQRPGVDVDFLLVGLK